MIEIVASNALLFERAEALRALFNSGHSLHLFKNPIQPTSATRLTDFAESTFPGYIIVNLNGVFLAPAKVQDGEYQTQTGSVSFTCTGPTLELCYGWLIRDSRNWKLAHQFFVPVVLSPGKVISFKVDGQVWATSVLKPTA